MWLGRASRYAGVWALCHGLLIASSAHAETGFSYTLVNLFPRVPTTQADESLCGYAFNDRGQVAYSTVRGDLDATVSLYFWDGASSHLVFSSGVGSQSAGPAYIFCSGVRGGIGLNNDGLISAYATAPNPMLGVPNEGFAFFRDGQGLVTVQFPIGGNQSFQSRGNVNSAGQVAFRSYADGTVGVASPTGLQGLGNDRSPVSPTMQFGGPIVNELGNVAQLISLAGSTDLSIADTSLTGHTAVSTLNQLAIWQPPNWSTPGLNKLGYAAVATLGPTTAVPTQQFRVILVSPDRNSFNTLASETNTTPQASALPGISLNESNEVLFATRDAATHLDALWLTTSPDTSPVRIWNAIDPIVIASQSISLASFAADSAAPNFAVNNASDVAFAIDSNVGIALIVAHPDPGIARGNPIPPTGSPLPGGGFRFIINCFQYGLPVSHPDPIWCDPGSTTGPYVDPPMASGYVYTADPGAPNFKSVFIPAPLPGGDSHFAVEFNGLSLPLEAGRLFQFTDYVIAGVSTFTVTGIDVSENLDPANPRAFVTALNFLVTANSIASFTMVPVLASPGPTITHSVTGTAGTNGWYTGDVTVTWTVTDPSSTIGSQTGCTTTVINTDTAGQTLTCTATSGSGTTTQSVTIKRDATAPIASGALAPVPNSNGWNNTTVTAHFTGTDATSGGVTCSADQLIAGEGAGQSATGTCTDAAGNLSTPFLLTPINIDKTSPIVASTRAPSPNAANWNNTPVVATFTATDALSGVNPGGACTPPTVTVAADGQGLSATSTCTDQAGNTATGSVTGINIDRTLPSASASAASVPNGAGWNNSNVTVTFTGTDSLSGSGLVVPPCSAPMIIALDTPTQLASGTCADAAGNTSLPASLTVKLDKTSPTANISTPANGASYVQGSAVNAAYGCADALSGIATCAGTVPNGSPIDTSTAGTKTFAVTPTDVAGNVGTTASASYTVTGTGGSDTTPPVITPTVSGTLGDNGWYRSNVAISWQLTDPESAITAQSGCSAAAVTNDTNGRTFTCQATSTGGTSSRSVTIKRDSDAPVIGILSPLKGLTYTRNQQVPALYGCVDGRSGVAQCTGTVVVGSRIDTASPGTKSFTVNSRDRAGNTKVVTMQYAVR